MMLLACHDLTVSYHHRTAISGISCQFKAGTTTAIIGPNGAGKSTFLGALLGQIPLDSGQITMQNMTYKDIAYLPQSHEIDNLLPLTVEDVVLLGSWYEMGMLAAVSKQSVLRVNDCLSAVGLIGFNSKYVSELSKGQLQRVLLARTMMQQASVIILDEPFNALDTKTIQDILVLIKLWQQQGKIIIAVLHNLTQVANYFDYTMLLATKLIQFDTTEKVLNNPYLKDTYTTSFI